MRKLFFLAVLACLGCGPSQPDPQQACLDVVDAATESFSKCGIDAATARSVIQMALGGCSTVVSIRDENELYTDCIPELKGVTCAQWMGGSTSPLPSACVAQLQH